MNIEQAKTIPISLILDKINFVPQRTTNDEILYFSPLRDEKEPSFFVNTKKNVWYDFGISTGGDIVDLVELYLESQGLDHTTSDALRYLKNMSGYVPIIQPVEEAENIQEDKSLALKEVKSIKQVALIKYAEKRGIQENVLRKYLKQATIFNKKSDKLFTTLCMKNEDSGYELRNPFFKGCIGKKGITFIRGSVIKPPGINIFEGAFDYLSVIAQQDGEPLKDDTIILHTLGCMKQGAGYIKGYGYSTAYTWMDNDDAGKRAIKSWTDFFATEENLVHMPMNDLYIDCKDVNEAHMKKLGLTLEVT